MEQFRKIETGFLRVFRPFSAQGKEKRERKVEGKGVSSLLNLTSPRGVAFRSSPLSLFPSFGGIKFGVEEGGVGWPGFLIGLLNSPCSCILYGQGVN